MPVWLTDDEYRTLTAACERLIPPRDGTAPGAAAAGVPDYIDGLLGAFTVDPPRIWARGPTSGRHGGSPAFAQFHELTALDELAWRTRIEGSCGLPEREFNGPVIGLQQRYRDGLAALGPDFGRLERPSRTTVCGTIPSSPTCSTGTPAKACTARRSTAATGTVPAGGPSTSRGTSNQGAGPTPRCPTHDRRRHHHRIGPGRRHRGRRAHRGRVDGGHHREGAEPPARPRGPEPPVVRLLERRDQVPQPPLPRPRPAHRAPDLPDPRGGR